MVKIAILAACFFAAAVYMGWRAARMKKDVYTFTDQLEQSLDAMAAGDEIERTGEDQDTLWSKVSEKLRRLDQIRKRENEENAEEKKKIKELVSDISHQTKTPIANLKMYVELMEDEEELSEKNRQFLQKMGQQTKKLDFLLQSMVKMSRLETGVIETHQQEGPLCETLGQAVAAVVPGAEKKQLRIYVECEESITVSHDKKWTEEALFNILDNAVKYTQAGGSIHISAVRQEIFTKISIRDTGKGIPAERQAEIFNRFYREPEVHDQEGIGVGLYLARKIITLQRGYIEVRSEPGKGADFRVFLPNE